MKVPEEVIKEAQELIDVFGEHFKYLGRLDDADFYLLVTPDSLETGYSNLFQYKNGTATRIPGLESLVIMDSLVEER